MKAMLYVTVELKDPEGVTMAKAFRSGELPDADKADLVGVIADLGAAAEHGARREFAEIIRSEE